MRIRILDVRVAFVACVVWLASCQCRGKSDVATGVGSGSAVVQTEPPPGLELRLSNGKQGAPAVDRATLAPATPLGHADVNALLANVKPLATDPADAQVFALRPASTPPPVAGETIKTTFPPAPGSDRPPPVVASGQPLKVLRWQPEDDVEIAPQLSVTFSEPMIAVTSQGAAATVQPVKLTPTPKGSWRWIGTRTIVFDPEVRFPQATTYKVEIPAGTKSATGNALATAVTFGFETPPPTLVESYPQRDMRDPQPLDAPIILLFDQKIDPRAIMRSLKVTSTLKNPAKQAGSGSAAGDPWAGSKAEPVAMRLVEGTELTQLKTANADVAAIVDGIPQDQAGRWLVARPIKPMPAAARISIEIPPGAPSAEGPNKTTSPITFDFETYGALEVENVFCTRDEDRSECRPNMPFYVELNNRLDPKAFDPKHVTVVPAIDKLRVRAYGNRIEILGETAPRTKYAITIGKDLRDRFGQTLGTGETHEIVVRDAHTQLVGPAGVVVVDPAASPPALTYFTMNYDRLAVKLYALRTEQFDAYREFADHPTDRLGALKPIPGTKVLETELPITGGANKLGETHVDLTKALDASGLGFVLAIVEPLPVKQGDIQQRRIVLAQATKLAIDAYIDDEELFAFATELATGKPAAGVELELRPFGTTAKTDERGLAKLALSAAGPAGAHHLVARRGADVAILDGRRWLKRERRAEIAWYVTDDRNMYRPGEKVSIKGWLRSIPRGKTGDIGLPRVTKVTYVAHDAEDVKIAEGAAPVNALGGFDIQLTLPKTPNLGTATLDLVAVGADESEMTHEFSIEEFRRPEFEVSASASQGPFVVGGAADVTVTAKYYAGGPLPGAKASWRLTSSRSSYRPPHHEDFAFGSWTSWWGAPSWRSRGRSSDRFGITNDENRPPARLSSVTDASGAHVLHVDFVSVSPPGPTSVTAEVDVEDVNRQEWSTSTSFIVHSSNLYVGVKTARPFVERGKPIEIDLVGVDIDGKVVPNAKLEVKAVRLEEAWDATTHDYEIVEKDPQTCATTATAQTAVRCAFQTPAGGRYRITATIVDGKGHSNVTTVDAWVTGGERKPARAVQQELVELVPDRKSYAPGTTAELLVQSPFFPAEGVLTYRRSGITHAERITLAGPTTVVNVPIVEQMISNVYVQVDLVGTAPRLDDKGNVDPKLPRRPAYASGSITLSVPPKQRTLAVTVAPASTKLSPREQTTIAVDVKDAAGKPVENAEVAVFVVDEAILALGQHDFGDPVDRFYNTRDRGTRDEYMRRRIALAKPTPDMFGLSLSGGLGGMSSDFSSGFDDGDLYGGFGFGRSGFGPGGGGTGWGTIGTGRYGTIGHGSGTGSGYGVGGGRGGMRGRADSPAPERKLAEYNGSPKDANVAAADPAADGGAKPVMVRSNFDPLAAFAPSVRTNAEGKATTTITMPDNLTRYRVVALAAARSTHFGKGESTVTVRLPLMVRPSAPRFLNFGDTFELPVVVQNQTDAPMTVKLGLRTSNLALTAGGGRSVTVPANDRVEVRFPAAAQLAGTARVQMVASAPMASDAAELAMPVWTPATTEAFATYGVLDSGAVSQPVALPGQVVTQFGGLEVTTSSTSLQALTDALLYIVHYPFDCAEQRSSRILAITSLRDVLVAFEVPKMPSAAALANSMARDIEQLGKQQDEDGQFRFWPGSDYDDPYLTAYVTHALVRARGKGYAVPKLMLDRAKDYLREVEDHLDDDWGKDVKLSIRAFALYVRRELGDMDVAEAKEIIADAGGVDQLELETAGWLLSAMAKHAALAAERAAIVKLAMNKVNETAGAANFTVSYEDGAHMILASDERVDAVMLEALIAEQPNHDLIPKLVTGLLGHRKRGRWLSTQENSFVLQALELYFRTYEKVTPNFVARVWLGNDAAGEAAFRGRTTKSQQVMIAMADVAARDKQPLVIQKDGAGRLYYRIGMTYAPASLAIEPADHGFVVERRYEPIDDPKHVTRGTDGTWRIKSGARVRVIVTMVNEAERHHVALVDPMPAGFEAMNPALATTGSLPDDDDRSGDRYGYSWPWYEHQNMRDERVEAFASELEAGVWRYEYFARATTPGSFIVPPPKAEEMYMPETFGRGSSDRVIVE